MSFSASFSNPSSLGPVQEGGEGNEAGGLGIVLQSGGQPGGDSQQQPQSLVDSMTLRTLKDIDRELSAKVGSAALKGNGILHQQPNPSRVMPSMSTSMAGMGSMGSTSPGPSHMPSPGIPSNFAASSSPRAPGHSRFAIPSSSPNSMISSPSRGSMSSPAWPKPCRFTGQSPMSPSPSRSSVSSPAVPSVSRKVEFSPEVGMEPSPSRMRSLTAGSESTSTSTIVDAGRHPPQSTRSKSRLSQSGSLAGSLMDLVRSRSKSRRGHNEAAMSDVAGPSSEQEPSSGWLGRVANLVKPSGDDDHEALSADRKRVFDETCEGVNRFLKKVVGQSGEIALNTLVFSAAVLEYSPFSHLSDLCNTFISVWKAVQQVSMNRLAFLRLVQKCTFILESVLKELEGANDEIIETIRGPLQMLEEALLRIGTVAGTQISTPFLWRYARRDDTEKEIGKCDSILLSTLLLFNTTVQLRVYRLTMENSKNPTAHGQAVTDGLDVFPTDTRRASAPNPLPSTPSQALHVAANKLLTLPIPSSPTITAHSVESFFQGPPQVISGIQALQSSQHREDQRVEREYLAKTMRTVVENGSPDDILHFLGIERHDIPEAIKTLQRLLELHRGMGWGDARGRVGSGAAGKGVVEGMENDRESIEALIDALRDMSRGVGSMELPYWTITQFEMFLGKSLHKGIFSKVYQGEWNNRPVAIKILAMSTPSDLFVREMKVWKDLKHPNVLRLYGGSSATANPPWFFVSPYMENRDLVTFLKKIARGERKELEGLGTIAENLPSSRSSGCFDMNPRKLLKMDDSFRMLMEVAKGMEYLHMMGVLHGDLKAANVLVDHDQCCIISDFGQSELRSEFYRITGTSTQAGTTRWKAPELLDGSCRLTPATDIYAYGVLCVEVFTMGDLPWGFSEDEEIRTLVLQMDRRPLIPVEFTSPLLHDLIGACWQRDPAKRIPFSEVVTRWQRLRAIGNGFDPGVLSEEDSCSSPPYLSPMTSSSQPLSPTLTIRSASVEFFDACDDFVTLPSPQEVDALRMEDNITAPSGPPQVWKMPDPRNYLNIQPVATDLTRTANSSGSGRTSPPPTNQRAADARNERRYRLLLQHDINTSLTLPLWEPSVVHVGDVGYLSKPSGSFITLFNALKPKLVDAGGGRKVELPPMSAYGSASRNSYRIDKDKRSAAQKGLDAVSEFLAFRLRVEPQMVKRQSVRLRQERKLAHLYTESTEYHCLRKLEAAKAWFRENIEHILAGYGKANGLCKEDVFLVCSVLQAKDYGMLVSHTHPNGQAHFHVFPGAKKGQPWGAFTCDSIVPDDGNHGPVFDEREKVEREYATKVSMVGDPMKAVILGRLRFKPDSMEPTPSP